MSLISANLFPSSECGRLDLTSLLNPSLHKDKIKSYLSVLTLNVENNHSNHSTPMFIPVMILFILLVYKYTALASPVDALNIISTSSSFAMRTKVHTFPF